MSDRSRIEAEIRQRRAVLEGCLANERNALRQAADYQARRDRPSSPTRAYEHAQEMDRKAAAARSSAENQRREADRLRNEIRGLEAYLR